MNQPAVINAFRTLLCQYGAEEVPAYPDFSIPPWLHPDLVFPGFRPEPCRRFLFQPTQEQCWETGQLRTRVVLVWQQKPFHPDWLKEIPVVIEGFFHRLLQKIDQKNPATETTPPFFFQPRGGKLPTHLFQPRGCAWNIAWDAMPIGSVFLLSELMDHPTGGDVGICRLEIDRLSFLAGLLAPENPDRLGAEPETAGWMAWRPKDRRSVFCRSGCGNENCIANLRQSVDEFLTGNDWLEAFRTILEGYAFFQSPGNQHSRSCFLVSEFEKTFRPLLKKIVVMAGEETK